MDSDYAKQLEGFPGSGENKELSEAQAKEADKWESAMSGETGSEVPEFRGDKFGIANEQNDYYGETVPDNEADDNPEAEYDDGITDAAALINYGLDTAARELGVEVVVQRIKTFDASGRENPIKDFFEHLGIDAPAEIEDMKDEAVATRVERDTFRDEASMPQKKKSMEGAIRAINDMKELISEVEGADPRYDELRAGAKAAGKGYFEYAVGSNVNRGLTDLFRVLAEQKEKTEEEPKEETASVDENTAEANQGVMGANNNESPEFRGDSKLNPEIVKPN